MATTKNLEDDGHILLLADIKAVQMNAEEGEYHDFANEKFPAPKMALVEHLRAMMDKAMNGAYDNLKIRHYNESRDQV